MKLRLSLCISVVLISLLMSGGAFAGETAVITDESPSECTYLEPGETHQFEITVQYDLNNQDPDYISLRVTEDGFGDTDLRYDISDRDSSGTVTVTFDSYVGSNWEEAAARIEVFPETGSTSASDEVYYGISGSGTECDSNPEELLVSVDDPSDSSLPSGYVTLERKSDGENEFQEYNVDGGTGFATFDDNSFVNEGEYRIMVVEDSGESNFWGYKDTYIQEGQTKHEGFERGGVFITDQWVGSDKFALGEEIPVELTAQRPRHGDRLSIEIYMYPDGGERSDTPDAVYDHGHIGSGLNDIEFDFDAPNQEGKYQADLVLRTYFSEYETYEKTDVAQIGPFTVEEFEPPELSRHEPEDFQIDANPDEGLQFEVIASNPNGPDDDLTVDWDADGDQIGEGESITIDPAGLGEGEYTVTATASDGDDRTEDTSISWELTVIAPPSIESLEPGNIAVPVGVEQTFSVSATDPGAQTPLEYEWRVEDRTITGDEFSYTFEDSGMHTVEVEVENTRGVSTTQTLDIEAESVPPEITELSIDETEVVTDESVALSANAEDPESRDIDLSYTWVIGHEQYDEQETSITVDEPGSYDVELIVENEFGAQTKESRTLRVFGTPKINDRHPTTEELSLQSGEEQQFSVDVTHPEGDRIEYRWYKDGNRVATDEEWETQFEESGSYDIQVELTDENGYQTTDQWTVIVDSFRTSPRFGDHSSESTIDVTEDQGIVSFSITNPSTNDRDLSVAYYVEPPDGTEIYATKDVDQGGPEQFIRIDTLQPGESLESIELFFQVNDESLAGETRSFEYGIIYHPADAGDDIVEIKNEEIEIGFIHPDQETESEQTDGEGTEIDHDDEGEDDDIPGFGLAIAVASLLFSALILRRRIN